MQPFDIFLVVIGFIIIALSYFISEKIGNKAGKNNTNQQVQDIWTEKDEKNVREHTEVLLEQTINESVIKADDELSKISNEKIMSVSEYSDQILEKINQNHQEVVFLYNMLNEKESEIKKLIHQVDQSKAKMEDASVSLEQKNEIPKVSNQEEPIDEVYEPWNEMGKNNNEQILKMYKNGKTVIDIAKSLDLGQGEVKLVIDLFKGVKS
jgi:hypothetical protein